MERQWTLLVLLLAFVCSALAQNATNGTDGSYPFDPILQYRPNFAMSLPVQILMVGIVLSLTSVLLIHLVFTAQYHWPLAPVNYILQLSAVITLLVSLIATLNLICDHAASDSKNWPYMLTYIAVDVPPLYEMAGWTDGELFAWLLMNATTSALIQITHIQFLTLLFPSALERRLIFLLLGPLAIVTAIMQMMPYPQGSHKNDIVTAIMTVCTATLSLLFTVSLFIWGFLVNRTQAWRTDGGTAAFGAGALTLAIASTALAFFNIPRENQYPWIPGLMWSVILWQSFLGWWWWVGAGMGVGEVEELLRREEKRRRKRKLKSERMDKRRKKAETIWKGVTGALGYERHASVRRRGGTEFTNASTSDMGPDAVLERTPSRAPLYSPSTRDSRDSSDRASRAPSSVGSFGVFGPILNNRVGRFLQGWYLLLRHAHITAAREQAVENVERIQQVYGREAAEQMHSPNTDSEAPIGTGVVGWGLGSYVIRARGAEIREEGQSYELENRGLDGSEMETDGDCQSADEGENGNQYSRARRRHGRRSRSRQGNVNAPDVRIRIPESVSEANTPRSMWWWGPLQRWRLQDRTVYQ